MSDWSTLRQRLAGRWQFPLLVVSVLMLAGAFIRLRPGPGRFPPEKALEHLENAVRTGYFKGAITLGTQLLEQTEYTEAELARVHLELARAHYGAARGRRSGRSGAGGEIVEHYASATDGGQSLTADDQARLGRAYEWLGNTRQALRSYQLAIQENASDKSDLRKRVINLRRKAHDASAEVIGAMLDELLAELEDQRLDLRLWAIERKLDIYDEQGRPDKAMSLLVESEPNFRGSDQEDHFRYLKALALYQGGLYDEAETYLRIIRNRLDRSDEVHAMTGWLLGRTVMSDGGPQRPAEAISFFSDVITYNGSSPYAVASRIGMAEALGMLDRHDEAVECYRVALEALEHEEGESVVNRNVLRASISVSAEAQRERGDLADALKYSRLAARLVDPTEVERTTTLLSQLAQIQSARAQELFDEAESSKQTEESQAGAILERARALAAEAGATYVELARINTPDERRASESSWRAAEMYAQAGDLNRAAQLYRTFATERPWHPLVPRALLREGLAHQQMGRLEAARDAYQECYRRFPQTLDGARALVPMARCYLAMGPEHEEMAEKTLRLVLEDSEVFTPQAPEFSSALFLLGDVLNRRAMFEKAITTLEEALDRYPDDPRAWRARYLLADSYRRSGLALKAEMSEAAFGGELKQMRAASRSRFQTARELYRQLIEEYELHDPAELTRQERLYLRHSYLCEADCYFEVQDYRAALRLYEDAASTLKDSTAALSAYVQIINCHVFLGEPNEARAVLARAKILAEAIPDKAFAQSVSPETREDWRRYFDWLGESELF